MLWTILALGLPVCGQVKKCLRGVKGTEAERSQGQQIQWEFQQKSLNHHRFPSIQCSGGRGWVGMGFLLSSSSRGVNSLWFFSKPEHDKRPKACASPDSVCGKQIPCGDDAGPASRVWGRQGVNLSDPACSSRVKFRDEGEARRLGGWWLEKGNRRLLGAQENICKSCIVLQHALCYFAIFLLRVNSLRFFSKPEHDKINRPPASRVWDGQGVNLLSNSDPAWSRSTLVRDGLPPTWLGAIWKLWLWVKSNALDTTGFGLFSPLPSELSRCPFFDP